MIKMSYQTVSNNNTVKDLISVVIGGGCEKRDSKTKGYAGGYFSNCGGSCKSSNYTCGGSSQQGCFVGFNKQGCQYAHVGMCDKDHKGSAPRLNVYPDGKLEKETENRLTKTCMYDKTICDSKSNYNFFKNFKNIQDNGKDVSTEDMNKCTEHFCSLESTETCSDDPTTGKPFTSCSKYRSTGEEGGICSSWLETQTDPVKESIITKICNNDSSLGDCACARRGDNEIYKKLSPRHSMEDGCWWPSCKNKTSYLVPPSVTDDNCPVNVCQTIIDIDDIGRDVSINEINTNIDCNFASNVPGNVDNVVDPPSSSDTDIKKKILKWAIVIFILTILLLMLLFFLKK
jgi:hypothetical protein